MDAISIITSAAQRCNRLYPGETLDDDSASRMFDDLNLLVDSMSAKCKFLYLDTFVSATQTGDITLAAGSWAAIPLGAEVIAVFDQYNMPMIQLTAIEYGSIYAPTTTGVPRNFFYNGLNTIKMYPSPSAQTVKVYVRAGVTAFADQTTSYSAPPGYEDALGAGLAVRAAKYLTGKGATDDLRRDMNAALLAVGGLDPLILNVNGFGRRVRGNILTGGYY